MSDLHLEFGYQPLPGGDVLILAGDICEARSLIKEYHSTRLTDANPGTYRYVDFFEKECAKYQKVFYVMGNHEHYHGRFDKTYDELKSRLPANVTLLERELVEYNGVVFMGATLWTNCNNADSLTLWHLKSMMNDYRVVQNFYAEKSIYHKLIPEQTFSVHNKTMSG
jgi:Icc-related predicted phosphoesterase